jgi:hypothetical protein
MFENTQFQRSRMALKDNMNVDFYCGLERKTELALGFTRIVVGVSFSILLPVT